MIAANYTANLYCENEADTEVHGFRQVVGEYIGRTWADCARQARADGWKISADRKKAWCPNCVPKRNIKNRRVEIRAISAAVASK